MNNKIQSDEPPNKDRQQRERQPNSVAQNNCASSTDTSKATEQREKAPSSHIRWSLLFEFVLVIATCATVGVAYSQWKAMESQSKIMQEQLKTMSAQTSAAFQQVSAAKSSIKLANDALEDNRKSGIEQSERAEKTMRFAIENSRLEQRAWVGIRYIVDDNSNYANPFLNEGHKFGAKIGIHNTGKSIAKNVKVSVTTQLATENIPINKQKITNLKKLGVINPDSWIEIIPSSVETLTKSNIENVRNGRSIFYLTGRITYEDAFNRPHFTNICMQLIPNLTGFTACPFYNEAN